MESTEAVAPVIFALVPGSPFGPCAPVRPLILTAAGFVNPPLFVQEITPSLETAGVNV